MDSCRCIQVSLIRHGQVPGNLEKRYVGRTDESLTEEGAQRACRLQGSVPDADHIFSSPLRRCLESAALLYPDTAVTVIPELAECDFGEFEYKNYRELTGNPDYQAWIDSGGSIGFPGGEDRAHFQIRCLQGFEQVIRIARQRGCRRIAMIVHGGTIMAILDKFSEPHADYYNWQCRNLEGYCCDWDGEILTNINKIS